MATIATRNSSWANIEHNARREKKEKEHIREDGRFEILYERDVLEVYSELFAQAIIDFNAKQKNKERRIESPQAYYQKILANMNKTKSSAKPIYEMVVGVYGDEVPHEMRECILRDYIQGWQERNPNFKLVGVYFHDDETNPHIHIDYVPFGHKEKGLGVQNNLSQALREMGFEEGLTRKTMNDQGEVEIKEFTKQQQWQSKENEYLERVCEMWGFKVDHPQSGKGIKRKTTNELKLQGQEEQIERSKNRLREINHKKNEKEVEYNVLKAKNAELSEMNDVLINNINTLSREQLEAIETHSRAQETHCVDYDYLL